MGLFVSNHISIFTGITILHLYTLTRELVMHEALEHLHHVSTHCQLTTGSSRVRLIGALNEAGEGLKVSDCQCGWLGQCLVQMILLPHFNGKHKFRAKNDAFNHKQKLCNSLATTNCINLLQNKTSI